MRYLLISSLLAAGLSVPTALAQSDDRVRACQEIALRANDAIADRDVDALTGLYWESPEPCGTVVQGELLSRLYQTAVAVVRDGLAAGESIVVFEPTLVRFENYPSDVSSRSHPGRRLPTTGMPWRLHYYLGLLRQAQHEYREAAYDYGQAFRASQDVSITPAGQEAGSDFELDMLQRQQEMMLAAGNYAASPSTRDQVTGIIAQPVLRSDVEVRFVALPIWFEYDESTFTPDGHDAAVHLAAGLAGRGFEPIVIIAHTDERGSVAYNQTLSAARAETLRDFLVAQGYPAEMITTDARGESCPYMPSDITLYDTETEEGMEMLYQLDRRAEIVWPDRQCSATQEQARCRP